MSKVLEALRKRRKKEVKLGDETVYLRAMTLGEVREQEKLDDTDRVGFAFGCSLINSDESPVIPRETSQSASCYAQNVMSVLEDVPQDTLIVLSDEIRKLNSIPDVATIRKN